MVLLSRPGWDEWPRSKSRGTLECRQKHRRTKTNRFLSLACAVVASAPCWAEPIDLGPVYRDDAWLSAEQHRRADRLVSFFENDTIVIQYAYVEALGDGRGYTAGRGFTTSTGDALAVIERFSAEAPRAGCAGELDEFLPELRARAEKRRAANDGLAGLGGFPEAWRRAAASPACGESFRRAQDEVDAALNYLPAMKAADAQGLRLPLSRAALYDAAVVHGMADDPDGLPALIRRTNDAYAVDPRRGETEWLRVFLKVRRQDLADPADAATRAEWSEGTRGRTETFDELLDDGNVSFAGPIVLDSGNFEGTIP